MPQSVQYLKFGEFFSGPGGLALGAILAESKNGERVLKIKHAWSNDYDPSSCETYKKNICKNEKNPQVICRDVRDLDIDTLSSIDIFAYGFPCNDFSVVGEQKGFNGKFGPLYSYGINVLNKFKPRVFVAENVGGIASANDGRVFIKILDDLARAGNGYKITAHLYKAEDYGVSQTRHRYIIVGIDQSIGVEFKVPKPTHKGNYVPVKVVLSNIPENAFNNEHAKVASQVVERLKHTKPGENAWTANLPAHLKLNVKTARMSQIYKRLHPDLPSYTITGSGGGGTHGYHYAEPRPLTNRERARIQSFPDDFEFVGSKEKVRKQIGMAVPPMLSNVVFKAILDTLNNVEYPYVEANYQIVPKTNLLLFEYEQNCRSKNHISETQRLGERGRDYCEEGRVGARI